MSSTYQKRPAGPAYFCYSVGSSIQLTVLLGRMTLRSGKQFLTIFLNDLSSFQATEWIHELSGLYALQLSQISWTSSRTSSTLVQCSPFIFRCRVDKSMGYLTTSRQSVRPMPFQSTGSRKSKESLDSLRQFIIIFSFLCSSLSSFVEDVSLRDDFMAGNYIIRQTHMLKLNPNISALSVLLLIIAPGVLSLDRKATEHYNRQEFSCSQKCQSKGYLKELCTRICMSPRCFRKIYGERPLRGKLEYQLQEDPEEVEFQKCWYGHSSE